MNYLEEAKDIIDHNIRFLFYDSTLFSDMDPRHLSTLLKIAYGETGENNLQYIVSLNESMVNGVEEYFSEDEFGNIIRWNICLELIDKSSDFVRKWEIKYLFTFQSIVEIEKI